MNITEKGWGVICSFRVLIISIIYGGGLYFQYLYYTVLCEFGICVHVLSVPFVIDGFAEVYFA